MAPNHTGGDDLDDEFQVEYQFSDENIDAVVQDLTTKKKKKRKRKSEVTKAVKRQKLEEAGEEAYSKLAAFQSAVVQAEYFNALQAKTFKDKSPLELDSIKFQASSFTDTTEYGTERDLEKLPDFISQVTPTLKTRLTQKPANKGAPTLIFITGAALRAAEVTRLLRTMRGTKGGEIAKLFAKHFKLQEHAEYLQRTAVAGGVGTAGRIGKLLGETESLSLKALTHIVVDASHRDAKMRTIFDIPETREALMREVFGNQALKNAIDAGKVTIVLF